MSQCFWSNLYGIIYCGLLDWCVFPKVMWWQMLRGRLMLFPLPGGLITWSHNHSTCQNNHPREIGRLCQQQTWETAGGTQRDCRKEKLATCILSYYYYIFLSLSITRFVCLCACLHLFLSRLYKNGSGMFFLSKNKTLKYCCTGFSDGEMVV